MDKVDIDVIKDRLFSCGDYLPFAVDECSDRFVDDFLISESCDYENPLSVALLSDDSLMYEGLIRTYPIDVLKRYVCKSLGFNEKQFQIREKNGQKCASIYFRYNEETREWLIKAMNLGGYYMSQEVVGSGSNAGLRMLRFEPKFEDDIYNDVIENSKVLYHVTEKKNIDRIRHIGICSRSNCPLFDYPDRIYLLKDEVSDNFISDLARALSVSKYGKSGGVEYSLVVINPKLLPRDTRFYTDANLSHSIFMYGNIPPKCIVSIRNL